ncbi:DUF4115 domain-containing protein, partial [Candidatus Omnitrophota bacterium]
LFLVLSFMRLTKMVSSKLKEVSEKRNVRRATQAASAKARALPKPAVKRTVSGKGIRIDLLVKERGIVKVIVDGSLAYKGPLAKGTRESWDAKKKIVLSLGNAGGVQLLLNGRDMGSLGKRGEAVKNIVITSGGLNSSR